MKHFGIITPPVPGHVHPMAALARELMRRGHRATWFHVQDLRKKVESEGIPFHAVGLDEYPEGYLPDSLAKLGKLHGTAALNYTIQAVARTTDMFCREGADALSAAGVDAMLVDQVEPVGGTLAEHLGIPYVTVCNAMALNRDPFVPPPFTPWRYSRSIFARLRNAVGYAVSDFAMRPIMKPIARRRAEWNLPAWQRAEESWSRLAEICQMPREFDFPRVHHDPHFHYVGPLREGEETTPFPWEKLDGRPIAYASLGTLQNRREEVFRTIAEACGDSGYQLVMSHAGGLSDAQAGGFADNALMVPYAPQRAVLARASLTITHAGLNTVLDSLAAGVPMITVPIAYEQPAISRRVEYTGAGKTLPLTRLSAEALRSLVREVSGKTQYRDAAQKMARSIEAAGGARRAADIVEDCVGR